ncbi:unnamed protein product [Closterium sp. Naga37s-1]|nr:unnamed protein product [Closterium sp. Naga37s-1]
MCHVLTLSSNPPTFPSILFPNPPLPLPLNPTAPSSPRDVPFTPLQGLSKGESGVAGAGVGGLASTVVISSPFPPFPPLPLPLSPLFPSPASTPLSHPPRLPFFPPRTVPFTPLQGFLRGAREWQVQERRAEREGTIRVRVVDERAPMAALAADGATPLVIRETNYGFSTCKVGGNGCGWVRLSAGGAGGGYLRVCGGCKGAYGSPLPAPPLPFQRQSTLAGVNNTSIPLRLELLALAANISASPTFFPPPHPPAAAPEHPGRGERDGHLRQSTPAGVNETAIRFRPELLALAANISASMNGGEFDAVHVRRGDKLRPEFWPHLDHDTRPDA